MSYHHVSSEVKKEIISQFKNGKNFKDLHKEFGVSYNSLYRWTNGKSLGDKRKHIKAKVSKSINTEIEFLAAPIPVLESFVSGVEQLCQEYRQFQVERKSFQKEKENYNNIITQLKYNTENLLEQMKK